MGRKEELQDKLAKEGLSEEEQRELDTLIEAEGGDKKTDEEEFSDAFDEAMGEGPSEEKKDDASDEDNEDDSDDSTEDDIDGGLIKPPVEEDTGDIEDDDEDWETRFHRSEQRMKSWEGRIRKANKRAEEAERKLAEIEQSKKESTSDKDDDESPEGDDSDDESAEAINEFIQEYPSLEKPIKAIAKSIAKTLIEKEINSIRPDLEKLNDRAEIEDEAVADEHFSLIKEAHPDFEEIRDSGKLKSWLDGQESFVRYGFERVMNEGTADEVIDMFDHYKGKKTVKNSRTSSNNQRTSKREKAKKFVAVDGESGGPIDRKKTKDKDDFDGAWNEALASK